jgi:hypothetical protein
VTYADNLVILWRGGRPKKTCGWIHEIRASRFLQGIAKNNAELFVHWRIGMTGTFA